MKTYHPLLIATLLLCSGCEGSRVAIYNCTDGEVSFSKSNGGKKSVIAHGKNFTLWVSYDQAVSYQYRNSHQGELAPFLVNDTHTSPFNWAKRNDDVYMNARGRKICKFTNSLAIENLKN